MEGESIQLLKLSEAISFQDSDSNGILDQPITLAEVNYVVKAIKNNKSAGSNGICKSKFHG